MENDLAIFQKDRAFKKVPRIKWLPFMCTKRVDSEDYYIGKKV